MNRPVGPADNVRASDHGPATVGAVWMPYSLPGMPAKTITVWSFSGLILMETMFFDGAPGSITEIKSVPMAVPPRPSDTVKVRLWVPVKSAVGEY